MSVLRYHVGLTLFFGSSDPLFFIIVTFYLLSLVLCCDIYRSTLISIMYPACMITVHGRKSRALQLVPDQPASTVGGPQPIRDRQPGPIPDWNYQSTPSLHYKSPG